MTYMTQIIFNLAHSIWKPGMNLPTVSQMLEAQKPHCIYDNKFIPIYIPHLNCSEK